MDSSAWGRRRAQSLGGRSASDREEARTGEEIKHIMSGMMGMRLKRLMRPLIKLKVFLLRRRGMHRIRQQHIAQPTSPAVVDVAMESPVLSLFGRDKVAALMRSARLRTYEPGEVVLYRDEPAEASGLLVVTGGTLASVNAFTKEHTPIESPLVLRDTGMLTEEPAPAKVVARSVVDVFILNLKDVRATFRSLDAPALEKLRELTVVARRDAFAAAFPHSELFMRLSWVSQRLSDAEMREYFMSRLVPVVFFPGDVICTAGTAADAFWCIRRGTAEVLHGDGEVAARVGCGATVGELSLCFRERFGVTVRAATIVDAWCLGKYHMDRALEAPEGVGALIRDTAIATRKAWLLDHKARTAPAHVPSLRSVPYLADAPDASIDRLLQAAVPVVSTVHSPILSVSDNCDGLYVIARGLAAAQRLETRESLKQRFRYGEGAAIGATCVVEHRNPISVCSLRMVDAWHVPRDALIAELESLGRLDAARDWAAAELRRIELELRKDVIPPRMPAGSAPVQMPTQPTRRAARFLVKEPIVYGDGANTSTRPGSGSVIEPSAISGNHGRRASKSQPAGRVADPAMTRPAESDWTRCTTHVDYPDVNFGPDGVVGAIARLGHLPTARLERFRSIAEVGGARLMNSPSLRRQLVAAAASYDPDASDGHTPSKRRDENEESAEIDTRRAGRSDASDADSEAADTQRRAREKRRRERMDARRRSVLPATFVTVREAEAVGDWAPWLFVLLQRKPALDGFLEGSEPGPLDVVDQSPHQRVASLGVSYDSDALASRPMSPASGRESPRTATAASTPAAANLDGADTSGQPRQRRVVRAKAPAKANRYMPKRPHSYCFEPSPAEDEAHARALRAAQAAAARSSAAASEQDANNKATSSPARRSAQVTVVAPPVAEDDLITRIVQHGAETVDMAKDERLATPTDDFFESEWSAMMATRPAAPPTRRDVEQQPRTTANNAPAPPGSAPECRPRPTPLVLISEPDAAANTSTPASQQLGGRRYSGIGAFGKVDETLVSPLLSEGSMSLASPLRPDTPEEKPWRRPKRRIPTTKPADVGRSHFAGEQDRTPNMARLFLKGVGRSPPVSPRRAKPDGPTLVVGDSKKGTNSQLILGPSPLARAATSGRR